MKMRVRGNENVYLVMSGYGRDESVPTLGGVFCCVSWVGVTLLVNRSQRCCRPSAAVGADLSCPHIRVHPQNGGGERIFDNVRIRAR
ncbi:hypothetical protein [Prevotella pallens]|uniref:hypothetical protein n=1 Tax=Prevotella pallens TaxID=60133 RepID=UPI0028D0C2A9|nr:hypothetical protein [Prevotella pallens]